MVSRIRTDNLLADLIPSIEQALDEASRPVPGCPAELTEAIRYSLLAPGKRLRPALVLMAAEACQGSHAEAMPAAVAVEMIHAYSLVHDDLPAMDDDDLRRGRPTCHVQYGEAIAILTGDALQARAFEVLATGLVPAERASRACAELARAAGPAALVGGQAEDLAAEATGPRTLERLEAIHRRKTGALFTASLRLGGIAAGAGASHLEALSTYAENLGLAFQIVDDLLDHSGDAGQVGKRTGKDAERGKLTYPVLLGVEASRRRAEELVERAREVLELLGASAERLDWLAGYVLERSR